jgi:hypothetical protein
MITINFEETFDPITIESDLSQMTFQSPQVSGANELLLVKISPHPDPHLPNVYNLGFGPPNGNGGFQDNTRLKHSDTNRVFSTVLFHGLTFLQENPDLTLGIDGSDDLRATMYHLMLKANRAYLDDFFVAIGVDWYVRVFRNWNCEVDSEGNLLAKPKPEIFDYDRSRHDLYRYYMFHLR